MRSSFGHARSARARTSALPRPAYRILGEGRPDQHDFIDNSAGVDCSDKEVNIKIPLNREMRDGRLSFEKRNALLAKMTEEVADMVLEDNRLQTLALSIAESGGARALPEYVRTIELLEQAGRIDRKVEGLQSSEECFAGRRRRRGLTRPELAVVLSMSKLALQDAAEDLHLAEDKMVGPELYEAFPKPMRKPHADAIRAHRLRNEILATRVANRLVNRLGPSVALDMTEEEGASLASVVTAFSGRRTPARLAQAVGRDRADAAAGNGPRRAVRDRREQRARAFVGHPSSDRRRDEPAYPLQDAGVRRPKGFDGSRQAHPSRSAQ
jgi:hypothetical protein